MLVHSLKEIGVGISTHKRKFINQKLRLLNLFRVAVLVAGTARFTSPVGRAQFIFVVSAENRNSNEPLQ